MRNFVHQTGPKGRPSKECYAPLIPAIVLLLLGSLSPEAQEPPTAVDLPVKRVVLYKAGIGYFEHLGTVRNNQPISIRFTSAQLDDALKSLTAIDLGRGQVRVLEAGREIASGVSGSDGRFNLTIPAGSYTLRADLAGFSPVVDRDVVVNPGEVVDRALTMRVADLTETVTVSSQPYTGSASGRAAGSPSGPPSPPPAPMPKVAADAYEQLRSATPAAEGSGLGEMFEYRLKEPVTLRKNQSALVPIGNAELAIEKVSLWNRASGSGRPLKAIWLANSSGLTLDGGSVTIVDGDAFAGEGLIDSLKPGEKRLVSYATDLGVQVCCHNRRGAAAGADAARQGRGADSGERGARHGDLQGPQRRDRRHDPDRRAAQRSRIVEDQARVRENMKALRGSGEERQLLQRYTRQLDEQEDRLADLQRQIEAASAERDRLRAELGRLIGTISFELRGRQ